MLRSVGDDDDDDDDKMTDDDYDEARETPAERRRREAALGMSSPAADDSDEDDGLGVRPTGAEGGARRGIRFADQPPERLRCGRDRRVFSSLASLRPQARAGCWGFRVSTGVREQLGTAFGLGRRNRTA